MSSKVITKTLIGGLVFTSSCFPVLSCLPSENNQTNIATTYQANNSTRLAPGFHLDGIDPFTIDHRVVAINLESWVNPSGIITADKLNGYKTIKSGSFNLYGMNISEIHLPDTMKTLEAGIFDSARQDLKKLVIPASVDSIEGNIFIDCDPQEVIVENTTMFEMVDGCLYDKQQKKLLMVLPKAGDNPTRTIRIKPDTKIIAPYAFGNLFGAGRYQKFKLVMDDFKNVTEIQDFAFMDANIESFNITNNVTKLGKAAFSGFMGTLSSDNANYSLDNYPNYDVLVDKSTDTAISLINQRWAPYEFTALNFDYTHIGESFYIQTGSLLVTENMNFSKKVLDIGSSAFTTVALKRVIFAPYSKLNRIDDFAFSNVNNGIQHGPLASKIDSFEINLPRSLRSLGESLVYNSGKGKVIIPNTVEHIGPGTNLNSWEVDIDLEAGNPNYTLKDGVIIENKTQTAICYDSDYLADPASKGILITDVDVKKIAPRSFTMLLANPNFKGFEIKNPDIVIGNGAFLNTGEYKGVKQDMKVPDSMPELTKRYIITQVMSWDFGPIQDYSNTGYGGGSWRGTVNGVSAIPPIPVPPPYPAPGNNSTILDLNKTPVDIKNFLPSNLLNLSHEVYMKWFTTMNLGPNTVITITNSKADNLNGTFMIGVEIKKPIIAGEESPKAIYQEFYIRGMRKATQTVLEQTSVPADKITVPSDFSEIDAYIGFVNTGDIVNHDGIKSYSDPAAIIKTKYTVVSVLNKYSDGTYWDNYHDGLLHVNIKIDNYYNAKGDFIAIGDIGYKPMYQTLNLKGFDLYRQKAEMPQSVKDAWWIVVMAICLVALAIFLAIIIMCWKRKRREE